MTEVSVERATFREMAHATTEEWQTIAAVSYRGQGGHVDRIIHHLKMLDDEPCGYAIDRLPHSLQTATRAFRDGRDEEYVVCALLHDIGDLLLPANHAELGAAIARPYVSDQNYWMMQHHGIFQGYYFFHHFELDRNMRERFRGHPSYQYTAEFCHIYDQNSFDPAYRSMQLLDFEPMLRRVMDRPVRQVFDID